MLAWDIQALRRRSRDPVPDPAPRILDAGCVPLLFSEREAAARLDDAACTGCEKCVRACPVEAMAAVSANDPKRPKRSVASLDVERCLGCGVCVRACSQGALSLVERGTCETSPRPGTAR